MVVTADLLRHQAVQRCSKLPTRVFWSMALPTQLSFLSPDAAPGQPMLSTKTPTDERVIVGGAPRGAQPRPWWRCLPTTPESGPCAQARLPRRLTRPISRPRSPSSRREPAPRLVRSRTAGRWNQTASPGGRVAGRPARGIVVRMAWGACRAGTVAVARTSDAARAYLNHLDTSEVHDTHI